MALLKSLVDGIEGAFYEPWMIYIKIKFYCLAIVTFNCF